MSEERSAVEGWASPCVQVTLIALLARASELHRRATGEEEYKAIWPILDEAATYGRAAFDVAIAALNSDNAAERAVGCDLLGTLSEGDEGIWGADVASAVIDLASREDDVDVLWSIARALGHAADHRGLATLVGLTGHPDGDVRYQVALALPRCEDGGDADLVAGALIQLMQDADGQVRDWATFGLGQITEIDGPEVRDAFLGRLTDEFGDVADEAMLGLARRRDPRALSVVGGSLVDEVVGALAVEAAAYLADERLLAALRGLESRSFSSSGASTRR